MTQEIEDDAHLSENIGAGESALETEGALKTGGAENSGTTGGSKTDSLAQKSGSYSQNSIGIVGRNKRDLENVENKDTEEEGLYEEVEAKYRSSEHEKPSVTTVSDLIREKSVQSFESARKERESSEEVEDLAKGCDAGNESAEDAQALHTTLQGSRTSGLGISRQISPDQLQEKLLALEKNKSDLKALEENRKLVGEEWSDDVWLQIAARQRALRRSRKPADIALRKQKYPELYRSDVSINPSYTEYKLPYFVVARQRYLRSLRIIQEQIKGDIEEMALLQPRALDGVRIIRTFCQGAPHEDHKDPLNPKDRRRLEYLLAGNIY